MKLEDIAKLENLKKDEVFVLWLHPATSKMTTMYCGHMNKPVNGGYWHSHTMPYNNKAFWNVTEGGYEWLE